MGRDRSQDAGSVSGDRALIDPKLLELLACPLCENHPPLVEKGGRLVCTTDGTGFPIVDGIPQLLPESAIEPARMKDLPL